MFTLQFETDNASFDFSDWSALYQIKIILESVADTVMNHKIRGDIRDSNGNIIGEWSLEKDNQCVGCDKKYDASESDADNQFDYCSKHCQDLGFYGACYCAECIKDHYDPPIHTPICQCASCNH